MKRITASLIMLLLVLPLVVGATPALKPDSDIKVYINDELISFEVDPIVVNGTTLVQFTPIFNKLGISYQWLPENQMITGLKGEQTIQLQINNPVVTVNDFNIKLSATPLLYSSRTIVPLRFVGEATGMQVDWNKEKKEIHIKKGAIGKTYSKPDFTVFTSSVDFNTKDTELLEKLKVEPDLYEAKVYTFSNREPFGYTGDMHVQIDHDDLVTSVSYKYSAGQLSKSVLLVYRDIIDQLETVFGPANKSQIMLRTEQNYTALKEAVPDQDLIRGLRNGTHEATSNWSFSDLSIDALLKNDGSKVIISVDFTKPIR